MTGADFCSTILVSEFDPREIKYGHPSKLMKKSCCVIRTLF